jgi:hypothetical protein
MKQHRFLNPILAGTYFNMSSILFFITIYLSHKFSHRYLFASTNQWTATRCPSKYTENYFKSRSYGAAVLDCDRVSVLLNLRWDDCNISFFHAHSLRLTLLRSVRFQPVLPADSLPSYLLGPPRPSLHLCRQESPPWSPLSPNSPLLPPLNQAWCPLDNPLDNRHAIQLKLLNLLFLWLL